MYGAERNSNSEPELGGNKEVLEEVLPDQGEHWFQLSSCSTWRRLRHSTSYAAPDAGWYRSSSPRAELSTVVNEIYAVMRGFHPH